MVLLALPLLFWLVQPWPILLRWQEPGQTAYMKARVQEARKAGRDLEIRQRWVPLASLPQVLVRAVLVAEDDRFYDHSGIDWEALAEEVRYKGGMPSEPLGPTPRATATSCGGAVPSPSSWRAISIWRSVGPSSERGAS